MSDNLQIRYEVIGTVNGELKRFAQPVSVPSVSVDVVADFDVDIAPTVTQTLWDVINAPSGLPTAFTFLMLVTEVGDPSIDIEFTVNEGNASETIFTLRLFAGVPLMLGADDSYFGTAAGGNAFASSLSVINKLRANNPDTEDTAHLKVVIGNTTS